MVTPVRRGLVICASTPVTSLPVPILWLLVTDSETTVTRLYHWSLFTVNREAPLRKTTFTPEHATFVRLLVEARKAAGLNQSDLAKRLGTYRNFISQYEAGQRRLDIIQIIRICQAIGVAPDEFVKQLVESLQAQG